LGICKHNRFIVAVSGNLSDCQWRFNVILPVDLLGCIFNADIVPGNLTKEFESLSNIFDFCKSVIDPVIFLLKLNQTRIK